MTLMDVTVVTLCFLSVHGALYLAACEMVLRALVAYDTRQKKTIKQTTTIAVGQER